MKNFYFKSVFLALLLIGSVLNAWAGISGSVYYDNSKTKWESVYFFIGNSNWTRSYQMTEVSADGDLWKTEYVFTDEWNDAGAIFFASTDGGKSSGAIENIQSENYFGLKQHTNRLNKPDAGFVGGEQSVYCVDETDNLYIACNLCIACKLQYYNGTGTSYTTSMSDSYDMTYDEEQKAYYCDVTTGATTFFYRFSIGNQLYASTWVSYPNGMKVSANGDRKDVEDITTWNDKSTSYYQGQKGDEIRVWFDCNAKKTWITKYSAPTYSITYTEQGAGWMYGDNRPTSAVEGAAVSFAVTAKEGYDVNVSATGATLTRNGETYSFTMGTSAVVITVSATAISYNLVYEGLEGISHTNPATYTVEDAITFAVPSTREGYSFLGWKPASIAKGTTGDKTITAQWGKSQITIYYSNPNNWESVYIHKWGGTASPTNWNNCPEVTDKVVINCRTYYKVDINLDEYRSCLFKNVSGENATQTPDLSLSADYDGKYTDGTKTNDQINWYALPENTAHTITYRGEHVTFAGVESSEEPATAYCGDIIRFICTPAAGYCLTSVKVGETALTAENGVYSYTIQAADGDIAISAEAEPYWTVTINSGEHGTITPNGEQQITAKGLDLSVTPAVGYLFDSWTCTGGAKVDKDNHLTATADGTVTANYEADLRTGWSLAGSMNEWNKTSNPFMKQKNASSESKGTVTISLDAGKTYEFKVLKDGSSWYGHNGTMSSTNCTGWTFTTVEGSNAQITTTIAGDYIFKIDYSESNPKVSVVYPVQKPSITFAANDANAGTVTATVDGKAIDSGSVFDTNDKVVLLTATPKEGYLLRGWYSDAACTNLLAEDNPSYRFILTESKSVYAKFEVIISEAPNSYYIYMGYAGSPLQIGDNDNGRIAYDETKGCYSIHLDAGKEYDLKVVKTENGTDSWYSVSGTMTATNCTDWQLYNDNTYPNIAFATTIGGEYSFDWNPTTSRLTAHYPCLVKEMSPTSVRSEDPSIMIQAYYWTHGKDNYGHDNSSELGLGYGDMTWTSLDAQAAELSSNFDYVWLAPSQSTADWTGFLPVNYSDQNNRAWGTEAELKKLIVDLHAGGAKVIADIVLNHANASRQRDEGWEGTPDKYTQFETFNFGNYGTYTPGYQWLTRYDEVFQNYGAQDASSYLNISTAQKKDGITYEFTSMEEDEYEHSVWNNDASGAGNYTYGGAMWSRGEYNFGISRDWAHRKREVREMSRAYLIWMRQEVGYDGFRYDFMKGFHASHIADYDRASGADFSVMEVFDGSLGNVLGTLYDANESTHIFDFPTKFVINDAIGGYNLPQLKNNENKVIYHPKFKKNAIVFAENHDSFREEQNSMIAKADPTLDELRTDYKREVLQANAFILSMPGVPCVFYPHWVAFKQEINAMIAARRAAGVHSESKVEASWAGAGGKGNNWYSARVQGKYGYLLLKLGVDAVPETAPTDKDPNGLDWVCAYADADVGIYYTTNGDVKPALSCNYESREFYNSLDNIQFVVRGYSGTTYDVYYTTNGSEPTQTNGTKWDNKALTITQTTTLKARAYRQNKAEICSDVMTVTFTQVADVLELTAEGDFSSGKNMTVTAKMKSGKAATYRFRIQEPGALTYKTFYTQETPAVQATAQYTFPGGGLFKIQVVATCENKEYVKQTTKDVYSIVYRLRHPFKDGQTWSSVDMIANGDGTFVYYSDGSNHVDQGGEAGSNQPSVGSGNGGAAGANTGVASKIWWEAGANVGTTGDQNDPFYGNVGSTGDLVISNQTGMTPSGESALVVWVYNAWTGELKINDPTKHVHRLAIKHNNSEDECYSNTILNANNATISFYATPTSTIRLEKYGDGVCEWIRTIDVTNSTTTAESLGITKPGVYTANITITEQTETEEAKVQLKDVKPYTGNFYIYSTNTSLKAGDIDSKGGKMTKFTKQEGEFYNHYWVRWLDSNDGKTNTFATVGNTINTNISTIMPEYYLPSIIKGESNEGINGASVRYGYDSETNYFGRTHLNGSGTQEKQTKIYGNNIKLADKELNNLEGAAPLGDVSDWIYDIDVIGNIDKSKNTDVKLVAKFNGMSVYLLSPDGTDGEAAQRTMLKGGANNTLAESTALRIIYDYKTNRIVGGWNLGGKDIENETTVDNLLVQRTNDAEATQFTVSTGKVVVAKRMTTEFIITRDAFDKWGADNRYGDDGDYKTMLFWISLPYYCNVRDIYGFSGGYQAGKDVSGWEIQRYRGDLRAQGTAGDSRWRALSFYTNMEPNRGYVLSVHLKRSDFQSIIDKAEIHLFFPSSGPVELTSTPTSSLAANKGAVGILHEGWNVMGVPVMSSGRRFTQTDGEGKDFEGFTAAYRWTWASGERVYEPFLLEDNTVENDRKYFKFLTGHAYMVQVKGATTLTWDYKEQEGTPLFAPSVSANALTSRDFRIDLMQDTDLLDKTYISYRTDGKREYELGRDLEKILNPGHAMIYSELNNKQAVLCLSDDDNVSIPLTVVIAEDGEYALRVPSPARGVEPVLYDAQTGITTMLNQGAYTVELSADTYVNRFFLGFQKAPSTPTGVGNIDAEDNGVVKFLDNNGNLLILRQGHVYDAQGHLLKGISTNTPYNNSID